MDSGRKVEQMMTAFYEALSDDCPLDSFWALVPESVSEVNQFDIGKHADSLQHFKRYKHLTPRQLVKKNRLHVTGSFASIG